MKKKTHPLLSAFTVVSLATGIVMIMARGGITLEAQLSGHGSSVISAQQHSASPILHGAAVLEDTIAGQQRAGKEFLMGALFILLGFLLHALLNHPNDRRVRITVVPKSQRTKATRPITKQEWYWLHFRV